MNDYHRALTAVVLAAIFLYVVIVVCIVSFSIIIDVSIIRTYPEKLCQAWTDYDIIVSKDYLGYVGRVRSCLIVDSQCNTTVFINFPGTHMGAFMSRTEDDVRKALHGPSLNTTCWASGEWATTSDIDLTKWINISSIGFVIGIIMVFILDRLFRRWRDAAESNNKDVPLLQIEDIEVDV